jgi:hypothetical protein
LFSHCGSDEFSAEGSAPIDLGRFITSIIVVTGFAFPIILAHSEVISQGACVMSIIGGACVSSSRYHTRRYLTISSVWYMAQYWLILQHSGRKIQNLTDLACIHGGG